MAAGKPVAERPCPGKIGCILRDLQHFVQDKDTEAEMKTLQR
jgi:hypothetical protein